MLFKGKLADQNEKKPRAPQSQLCIYGLYIPTTHHSSRYTLPLKDAKENKWSLSLSLDDQHFGLVEEQE